MRCPICRKEVQPGSRFAPFCSERCQLVDLGNWATERYRIASRTAPPAPEETEEKEDDDNRED